MSENDEDTTFCKNCRRQIGKSNFVLHEMHCKRNISLCEHCNEPIPRAEMEVHFEENHAKIPCPKCNKEVEKQHLEIHEEQECLKRPIKCVYCEMDVSKGDLEEHQEYCGSRTENCVRCGQFIMVKDMAQHEESRCSFGVIQPKHNNNTPLNIPNLPSNEAVTANRRPAPPAVDTSDDFLFGSGEMNSFQMDEIQRLLGVNGMGPSHQTRVTPSTQTTARGGTQAASSKIKKKDVNIERKNRNGEFNHNQNHDQTFLPCEFCGEAFPIDMLVLHQGSCTEDQLSSLMADTNLREDSDNRMNYPFPPAQRPLPNVIDNLHGYDDDSDPTGYIDEASPHDDMMLPCEFCDELFPLDALVQHQAVCDSDALKTPRVMSPVVRNTGATPRKVSNTPRGTPQHPPNINAIIYGKDHHATPPGPHSRDLDHTLRKYGSSSFDVYGARGQHQTNDSENISPPSPRRSTSRISLSSAARTRRTLGSLLSDNDSPIPSSKPTGSRRTSDPREATGSFVGISNSRKNNVNLNNLAKQTARSSVSSSRVPGVVPKRNDAKKMNTGASRRDYLDPDLEIGNLRPSSYSRSQRNSDSQYLPSTPSQSTTRQRDRTFDYGGDRTSKNRNPTKRRDQY